MTSDKRYRVTFYKTITTDYGRDREIEQRVVEVVAADEESALELAKREFCRLKRLPDWTIHADRCAIEQRDGCP